MEATFRVICRNEEDLDTITNLLMHIEYLGKVGASRNLLVRVDGDGYGQIKVYKDGKRAYEDKKYNIGQDEMYNTSGVYDIG